ncbi:ring finger domain-containing [Trichoderma arundinaceum]|uniref:RING-type E3 ubiquitin transferase n=1 Tax=Trichoderma arundinaceum TaxID=490622 RepID=A0A395NLS1_TRIAR|nr:ring finger domain-containing [Trichoderma arundinaceum]
MLPILLAVVGLLAAATSADDSDTVSTSPQSDVPPDWATNDALQMNLSTPGGQTNPLQYTVIPLIPNVGLNQTNTSSGTLHIDGTMIATDVSNFNKITNPNDVAYLSCDDPSADTFISTNTMLNDLIGADPKAIVLYSLAGTWCSLNFATPPAFSNILSMADSGEAQQVLGFLNGTDRGRVVNVSITGNASIGDPSSDSGGGGGSNSAVAMSILYTITGLITLLFLIIIATGAVRAHRYPERYGPRNALGGRPRQSRAKGLARAVLETLPIVKFNNQESTKPDPELELDTATTDGRDAGTQKSASILTEDARHEATTAASGGNETNDAAPAVESHGAAEASPNPVGNVGCSICTEDFTEGEDMRVLPCNHQFHPNCIDPWLINVSGTCPLCRLDLRPEAAEKNDRPASDRNSTLPPPLVLEGEDGEGSHTHHRHRISRFFDINRLRQATAEEQIEALRQMRSTRQDDSEAPEGDGIQDAEGDRGHRAHLSAKLKEKFRIRTRARSPERREE